MSQASISVTLNTRALVRAAELTNSTLGTAVQDLADEIVADAKANAPVDTGALRDSLASEVTEELEIEVHDGVDYGVYQEYGRGGAHPRPARPFLTPAVERARSRLPTLVGEALKGLWREAGGK
jgi:HK97 gp10 family phage protein